MECEICEKIKGKTLRQKNGKIYCFIKRKPHFVADVLEFRRHISKEWIRARAQTRARIIVRGKVTQNQWLDIIKSQDNKCKYCGKEFSRTSPPTMDHIIPLNSSLAGMQRGNIYYRVKRVRGTHSIENIAAACRPCNAMKNAHPPRELLFKVTSSEFYGREKLRDRAEKVQGVPISKVREWYFKNALKLVANKKQKDECGYF